MIICNICETPQFLQITESRITVNDLTAEVSEVYEKYECTWCGPTAVGALEITEGGEKELTGSIADAERVEPRAEI